MYVSMSHLRIAPERADELIAAFRDRVRLVDDFDGFEGLAVWRSDREPDAVIMVSRWRDRACFATTCAATRTASRTNASRATLQAAIKLERLDHLHTYEVVAR